VELAGIHRAKHYMEWYSENADNLGHALAETEPFNAYASTWIFTGAGGYHKITPGRFGAWAIHRLVAKTTPRTSSSGSRPRSDAILQVMWSFRLYWVCKSTGNVSWPKM
jgi:hypothetical protein